MSKAATKSASAQKQREPKPEHEQSRTEQHHRDLVDINQITRRWMAGTPPSSLRQTPPTYADYSSVGEFQDQMNRLAEAKSQFEHLDPELRSRFQNDVTNVVSFLENPENHKEAREIGLLPPEAEPGSEHSLEGPPVPSTPSSEPPSTEGSAPEADGAGGDSEPPKD